MVEATSEKEIMDMANLVIRVKHIEALRKKLNAVMNDTAKTQMSKYTGTSVLERIRDHLDTMSPHRHKTANRLGAKPTHHLEYASGRMGGVNSEGEKQSTDLASYDSRGFMVAIRNTPALLRAFGPVTVRPRKAKWLTIPIHKDAYGKRVKDLRNEGRRIFRLGKSRVLAETDPTDKKKIRPLYALCQSSTSRRDRGLLPTQEKMKEWATASARAYLITASRI